jgi:hypothetical protein
MSSVVGLKETQQGHALALEGAKLPLELLDHPLALPLVDLHRCGEQPGHELRETRLVDRDLPRPRLSTRRASPSTRVIWWPTWARRAAVTSPKYPAPYFPDVRLFQGRPLPRSHRIST